MLISPENIELNKIVKKRTFNFSTSKRTYGNLIFVATDTYDDYNLVFTSKLFKPQQLFSVYTPRKIKPMDRSYVTFIQKDVYEDIRNRTNGFLRFGKATLSSYAGRNLAYDFVAEYSGTSEMLQVIKKSSVNSIHLYLQQYLPTLINNKCDEINYEKNYIIFPLSTFIPEFKSQIFQVSSTNYSPMIEFLRSLHFKTYSKDKYKNISRIFFYNPNADAMVVMDPQDENLIKNFLTYYDKINRLNKFNNHTDTLDDVVDEPQLSDEDADENTKDKIKKIVIGNVAKTLKAKLDDYDAATSEEKSIISSIDSKVETYLSNPENVEKPFDELVKTIETDKGITTKAISYIETKRLAQKQLNQLQKNLDKETEVVASIKDLSTDSDQFFEPESIDSHLPDLINKKVQESSLIAFDEKYNKVQAKQDMVNNLTAFSDQSYLPLTIDEFKEEDTSDDFTLKDTISVRYRTDEGKTVSFKLDIPKIYDGHYIKIKGNPYIIQKQIFHLPIVKTKSDRVEITTNFNKITCTRTNGHISRRNAYLKKILATYKLNPSVKIEYGYNSELNSSYSNDFEYEEMSSFLTRVSSMKYDIYLNRPEVEKEFNTLGYPETFKITKDMTPVGFEKDGEKEYLLYIKGGVLYKATLNEDGSVSSTQISDSLYTFIVKDILKDDPDKDITIGKSYIYSNCKFIAVVYPIFVFCGLCEGITTVLKKAKVNYRLSPTPLPHSSHWVENKFKNKFFYYEDTPENSLLLSVLFAMHTEDWNYEDFDTEDPYVDYCVNTLSQPPYVKQTVKINITKLVDPITRDVLKYLKLPTDPIDLLLLANKMLTNNSYIRQNDLCNYRIRGNELVYAMMYEIIAKAYMNYQNAKLNGSNIDAIKIPQNSLINSLIGQQNVNIASNLNPILEVEASSSCSMKGFKGINLRDAYTTELRSFDKSMNGILSANSTPFSGAVGISRSLTVNPKLNNVRGIIPEIDINNLDATNRLSASELISFTTATRSDAPRVAMQVGQSKHGVPVYVSHKQLIGSGYDHAIPYMLSDTFCFKAKEDGNIESINDKEKLAILKYVDGTYDAVDLRESLAKNSNSGFYINQNYVIKYKVGESFKKGDIIAYNPSFFKGKGNDCSYTQGTLAKVAVTSGDFVFEDSTYISDRLSEMCASDITMSKPVVLGNNSIVHKMVQVGDHVEVNDDLINFTTSFNDPSTTEFLQDLINSVGDDAAEDLGNEHALSKYAGRVADIDIYYNVPFETLSKSLQDIITKYNKDIESRKAELLKKGIPASKIHIKATGQQKEKKINGTEFDGVLIIFYLTHKDKLTVGDKITYQAALKGIVTKVSSIDEAPFSEFRPNDIIDGCTASSGIPSRMTMDVFNQLYGNKLLIELGRWIHTEWNK